MREFVFDKPKSLAQARKELDKTCSVPGCGKPLTNMLGPGSDSLCREHQLGLKEYGGMGRMDRPHTFHRKMYCEECSYSPFDDPKYSVYKQSNPDLFNRLCRNQLIGDHQHRQADGGSDEESNIRTLCLRCNSDKTILNEDYKRGKNVNTISEDNN